ncbi:Uncharacterized protein FKW44_016162, partial [Caligus rogercresseyi]
QKSVQHWLPDVNYNKAVSLNILRGATNKMDPSLSDWFEERLPEDPYGYQVHYPVLYSLSHKIQHATRLQVVGRWSSTKYQVTNYGLGGLCEIHTDPHGLFSGRSIPEDRVSLFRTGDMILTLMGWLEDVNVGGKTAFIYPGLEALLTPTKGSAALWFNLHKNGHVNKATMHGGCPLVREGSGFSTNGFIPSIKCIIIP